MLLGAIIDAGAPVGNLNDAISSLGVSGVRIVAKQAIRGGVHGTHAIVEVEDSPRRSYRLEDFIRITESSSLPDSVKERSTAIFRRTSQGGTTGTPANRGRTSPRRTRQCRYARRRRLHRGRAGDAWHRTALLLATSDGLRCYQDLSWRAVRSCSCDIRPARTGTCSPLQPPPGDIPDAGEMITPTGAAIVTTLAEFSSALSQHRKDRIRTWNPQS